MGDAPTIETLARRQANDVTEMGITGEADVINQNETTMVTTTAFTKSNKRKWPGSKKIKKVDSETATDSSAAPKSKAATLTANKGKCKNPPNLTIFIVIGTLAMIAAQVTIIVGIGVQLDWNL